MAERWIDGRKETGFNITTRETLDCVYLIYAEDAQHALRAFAEEGEGDEVTGDVIESVRLTDPNPLPPWSPEAHKPDPEAAEAEEAKSPPAALPKALAQALQTLRDARAIDFKLTENDEVPTGDHYNSVANLIVHALEDLEQFVATGGVRAGEYEATVAELRRLDRENAKLVGALQWLLDDMKAAGEIGGYHTVTGEWLLNDSVEHAAAALVKNHGDLGWYTPEMAAAYRERERAKSASRD